MKALVRRNYGGPERILLQDVPQPKAAQNEVLVKVHCNTISRTDCGILGGKPYIFRFFVGWPKPRNPILGSDFAGEVVEVGPEVKGFKAGDHVFGFNDEGLGSQAQFVKIKESAAISHIPGQKTYVDAIYCAEGAHYALTFSRPLNLVKGSKVLVIGATGAIGSAAIQILRARGIRIDAVGPASHRDYWQEKGVESYWDYETEDFRKSSKKYAHVLDAVGKSSYFQCKHLLNHGGAYVSSELGPYASNVWLALLRPFMQKSKVYFPIPKDIPGSLKEMHKLLAAGKYKGLVDPLKIQPQKAEDAYHYACSGQKKGNLILYWDQD